MALFRRGNRHQEDEVSQLMGEALELFRSGHLDRARRRGDEAIALCRQLRDAEPDDPQHRRVLASLLYNHATVLNRMEREPEALVAILESCRLYEELLPAYASLHADALARAGTTLAALGRADEAVVHHRRAVHTYRSQPAAEPGLARVLALFAASLDAAGEPDEAVVVASEAVRRYEEIHARAELSLDAADYYALAARTLSRGHARRGEWEAASSADAIAVGVYRLLVEQDSPAYADQLATALADAAAHLAAAGRAEEGVAQARDAVRLVEQLDARHPGRYASAVTRISAVLATLR
jgi:tetratricopeptide (TPR) repeat protein